MEPLQVGGEVAPADVNHLLHGCAVIAGEETQEELVAVGDGPVELGVDIVEVECVVLEVLAHLQEGVEIGTARRDEEG